VRPRARIWVPFFGQKSKNSFQRSQLPDPRLGLSMGVLI
jgi:hypothetical protein